MIVAVTQYFIGKPNGAVFGFRDAGADTQLFIVARGMQIAAADFGDYDVAVVRRFHFFVLDAERTHQFHAADFKPDQEIGVVDHAHLIGFGVTHADGGVVIIRRTAMSVSSFRIASPLWLAFFEEGRQAFLEIGSAADAGILKNGALQVGVDYRRQRRR